MKTLHINDKDNVLIALEKGLKHDVVNGFELLDDIIPNNLHENE